MRVAVVGAGLAGLACAVDLARAGVDVTVFEARDRVGGRVWSGVMPDGARFERGGEFIEAGYDDVRRRAAEYDLPLVPQGFAFAAREVRSGGRTLPTLLLEAERELAATVDALGTDAAAATSAAEALARTPLEPLARRASRRRLEGTYTVELDRVSATWLSSAEQRAAGAAEASARLADGNDALAKAMASELGERVRLGCADPRAQPGRGLRSRRTRSPASGRHRRAAPGPARARELRAAAVGQSPRSCTCRSPSRPRPGRCRRSEPRSGRGRPMRRPSPPRSQAASTRSSRSRSGSAPSAGAPPFGDCGPSSPSRGEAVLTSWREDDPWCGGSYACHPPGWSQRDDEAVAAPYGRIHLAGEHTAAEFCGTMEGALRSGARAASEVLAEARDERLTMSDLRSTLVTG